MKLVEDLKWRYATKKFNPTEKVSSEKIDYIKEAVRLSASSYGLQPYTILQVDNPIIRERLKPLAHNQSPVTDASHLFIFCNYLSVSPEDVNEIMQLKAEAYEVSFDKLSGYGDFVKGKLEEKSKSETFHWTAKQAYIALANAICACADLKIDSLPMEGFDTEAINKELNLKDKGLNACVLLAVGYRSEEDRARHNPKVRKSIDGLFEML